MIPIARNTLGEAVGVLMPDTARMFLIDGSVAHAESAKLPTGIYRLAVKSSTGDAGVTLKITEAGDSATTVAGMWMSQGAVEFVVIPDNYIISVIDGILNVVPFM